MLGSRSRPLAVVAFGSPYPCQTWMRLPSPERLAHPAVVDWVGVRLSANAVPHSSFTPLLVPSALLPGWSWLRGWSGGLVSVGSSLCSGGGSFVVLPVVARGRGLAVTTQGLSGSCQTWMRLPSSERFAHPAVAGCVGGSLTVNAGPFLSGLVSPLFWSLGGLVCHRVGAIAVSVSSLAVTLLLVRRLLCRYSWSNSSSGHSVSQSVDIRGASPLATRRLPCSFQSPPPRRTDRAGRRGFPLAKYKVVTTWCLRSVLVVYSAVTWLPRPQPEHSALRLVAAPIRVGSPSNHTYRIGEAANLGPYSVGGSFQLLHCVPG